jgi:hypothetical protein
MDRKRIILVTLVTLVITPAAVAEIYRCDGPNGPIYSDKECGSDAANVEILNSSGLSGVTEQDKIYLAEKKQEREREREQEQALSPNQQNPVIINQYDTYYPERRGPSRNRPKGGNKPNTLPAKPPSVVVPAKPRTKG